jgi:hypothetical protein
MPDEPNQEELDEVEEHIQQARRDAQRDGLLPDAEHEEPKFIDPGTVHTELEDNNIAPPG